MQQPGSCLSSRAHWLWTGCPPCRVAKDSGPFSPLELSLPQSSRQNKHGGWEGELAVNSREKRRADSKPAVYEFTMDLVTRVQKELTFEEKCLKISFIAIFGCILQF